MIVVGIDLGVTGAVSAVDSRGSAVVRDLPIVEDAKGKRLDSRAFLNLLRELVPIGEAGRVLTEDVRVRQVAGRAMSHSTETTLVGLRFAVQSVVDIARLELEVVQPQTWKRHYGIKDDKTGAKARELATRLYPVQSHYFKRVKDHNRAESLLIAHYGQKVNA